MNELLKRFLSFLIAIIIIFSSACVGFFELGFNGTFATKSRATINTDLITEHRSGISSLNDSVDISIWQDRKWVAFGTSLTDTNNTLGFDGTATGKYTPYLEELSGLSLTNRGVAGARMSGHILYYAYYYSDDLRFADLVTVEGSVNDFASNVPLGEVGDTKPYTNADVQAQVDEYIASIGGSVDGTFAGACYQILKTIQDAAPRATIVYLTDNTGKKVTGGGDLSRGTVNSLGYTQDDYINMAVAVAKSLGVTVIDAGATISEDVPEYLIDHIHHTESGGKAYADAVWNNLKNISPLCPAIEVFDGNYFFKNSKDIENGGIYLSGSGAWTTSGSYFETGYIKIPINELFYLFGVDSATHWIYCDIDTKEFICGSNSVPVNGRLGFGAAWRKLPDTYKKDYVYLRVGLPKANIDDIVITVKSDILDVEGLIHNHVASAWIIDENSTCTVEGSKHKECTICGETVENEIIAENGHTSSSWITDKKATVNAKGKKHKECTECGEILETATIAQLKCSKPTLKKVSNTTSGVKVTWGKVSGADSYYVYRKTKGGSWKKLGDTSSTSYTDKTAKSGTIYYYTVRAKNEAGLSSYNSTGLSIKRLANPKLSKTQNTTSGVKITWGKVTGASGYIVYRKTKGGSWKQLGKTTKTYYTDKTAKSGTTYYYTVRAYSGSVKSYYDTTGLNIKYLADPTLKTPKSTKNGVSLKWTKTTGAQGYIIYRKTGNGSYKKLKTEKGVSNLSYVDKSAKKGKKYTYKVKAYYSKTYSAYSNTKTIKDKY